MSLVLYSVTCKHDSLYESNDSFTHSSKSRAKSDKLDLFGFTVLCRSKADALRAWQFHFNRALTKSRAKFSDYDINDYSVTLQRCKIDSRGFNPNYFIADGMREPLLLGDLVRDNVNRIHVIFA